MNLNDSEKIVANKVIELAKSGDNTAIGISTLATKYSDYTDTAEDFIQAMRKANDDYRSNVLSPSDRCLMEKWNKACSVNRYVKKD